MTTTHQTLIKQITEEAQSLPEDLIQEVLNFIGYLQTKYIQGNEAGTQETLLETFGSWSDERESDDIVQDIYATRTVSELDLDLR